MSSNIFNANSWRESSVVHGFNSAAFIFSADNQLSIYRSSYPETEVTRKVMAGTLHNMEEGGTPFLPFIVERLFSTFLSLNSDLKVIAHPIARDPLAYSGVDFEREVISYMLDEVKEADRTGVFSPELKRKMALFSSLLQQYGMAYLALNAHPHYTKKNA